MDRASSRDKAGSTFVEKNMLSPGAVSRRGDVDPGPTPPQSRAEQSRGRLWRSIVDRRAAQNCSLIVSAFRANDAEFFVESASDAREFFALHRAGELRRDRARHGTRAQRDDRVLSLQQF